MRNSSYIFYLNQWKKSTSKDVFSRKSLINKKTFFYAESNNSDIKKIISSAKVGLKTNKVLKFIERKKYLYKIYRAIKKNYKLLAKLETLETGKNFDDAKKEILHSAKIWFYASKYVKNNSFNKNLEKKHKAIVNYEPVGIVSLIIPWNFPFVVMSERLPFILAAGNSVIIKPSEYASQSLLYLMTIIKNINLPIGIVNLITGSGPNVGSLLTKNKNINMISFTGSTYIGKKIMKNSAKNIKRLSLELGGKNSFIVLSDADIKKTINIIIDSFTGNAGQSCVSTSRLFVDNKIKKKLIGKLLEKLNSIKNFKKLYGLVSTEKQFRTIKNVMEKNINFKRKLIFGSLNLSKRDFIKPIVFCDLPEKNIINKMELFGPILSINSFNEVGEAINKSNSTSYGLSAVICGKNQKNNIKVASELDAGRIWINESVKVNFPSLPIGGFKESGLNRESGNEGIRTYSEIKSIIIKK
ncbi:aldehyde dehydrogenase family protein [Candidatus Pelagibacter sp.]|nr:aldehyde dehydrogenase family protein [Candidatus Pelagibacter sp.]